MDQVKDKLQKHLEKREVSSHTKMSRNYTFEEGKNNSDASNYDEMIS